MSLERCLAFGTAFLVFAFQLTALAQRPSLSDRVDALITAELAKHPFAGATVAVTSKGESLLNKGYGLANLETSKVADQNTIYAIGSMSKQFTATAILQLADAGLIDLDQDIHTYVPQYPAHHPAETVRSLLSHTSGIPDYFPTEEKDVPVIFKPIEQESVIDRFANSTLDFLPGETFAYSNSNFFLLGVAIERVSGESYNAYLRHHIFQPADLPIFECATVQVSEEMAQGYNPDEKGQLQASPDFDMSWAFSAGNLCASAQAIVQWNQLVHKGKLLSPWAHSILTSAVVMNDGTPTTYGAGLFVDTVEGHRHFEHGGDTVTFHSQAAYLPDDDLTIVILTNASTPLDRYGLERSIAREVLGLHSIPPTFQTVPEDLELQISGFYNIPGREVLGPNPLTVEAKDGQASVEVSGHKVALLYQGEGKFVLDVGNRNLFFQFPFGDGLKRPVISSVNLSVNEMLIARGFRTDAVIKTPNVMPSTERKQTPIFPFKM